MDLYNIVINDPVYLTIAVILSIFVLFTAIKKMFKYLVVLISLCICYIGYLAYMGEEIPQTTDELIDDISKKAGDAVEVIKDKTDDALNEANFLLKNNKK
tara:strand:- start:22116 stop:22415 length:300 start_codon:yes stop_codon:yes gene_type:complete